MYQASKVPEKHHRPLHGSLSPSANRTLAEFEIYLLPASLAWLPASPLWHSHTQNVPSTLPNINLFTFPPKYEVSVFDPKQLLFPGWRQNSSSVLSSLVDRGDVSSPSPVFAAPPEAWHTQFCLSCFPWKFHGLSGRLDLHAGSRGSIFSDSSYSVSSSMMRALSSKYWVTWRKREIPAFLSFRTHFSERNWHNPTFSNKHLTFLHN